MINETRKQELRNLTDRYEALMKECNDWCEEYIMPLSRECKTKEELNRCWAEFRRAVIDRDGQFRDLPALMEISWAFEVDRVRQQANDRNI